MLKRAIVIVPDNRRIELDLSEFPKGSEVRVSVSRVMDPAVAGRLVGFAPGSVIYLAEDFDAPLDAEGQVAA